MTNGLVGMKNDEGKARFDLLSPEALQETAEVLAIGAKKYSDRNYLNGLSWSRVFAATMRHLWAFWRGEDNDLEDGKSHLAHAMCCVMMLYDLSRHCPTWDNRPYRNAGVPDKPKPPIDDDDIGNMPFSVAYTNQPEAAHLCDEKEGEDE